jgi:prepilin-type N-terminal cleavage/methylation domain-containing protein
MQKAEKALIKILLVGKHWNSQSIIWKNRHGFSLFELILVLLLIALMAGLTTPILFKTLDRITSQTSARSIATVLRYARSKSISEKISYTFNANIDTNQYWINNVETEKSSEVKQLDSRLRIIQFFDSDEEVNTGPFYIVFYPQGNSSGGEILIETTKDKEKIRFTITLDPVTGKPNVEIENL